MQYYYPLLILNPHAHLVKLALSKLWRSFSPWSPESKSMPRSIPKSPCQGLFSVVLQSLSESDEELCVKSDEIHLFSCTFLLLLSRRGLSGRGLSCAVLCPHQSPTDEFAYYSSFFSVAGFSLKGASLVFCFPLPLATIP